MVFARKSRPPSGIEELLRKKRQSGIFSKKPCILEQSNQIPLPAVIAFTRKNGIYVLVHTNIKRQSSSSSPSAELFGPLDLSKDLKSQIQPKYSWESIDGSNNQPRKEYAEAYDKFCALDTRLFCSIGNVFDLLDNQKETVPALAEQSKTKLRKLCHSSWPSALQHALNLPKQGSK